MKYYRTLLTIVLLIIIALNITASPTSKEDALKKAQQFYAGNINSGLRSGSELKLAYSDTGKVICNSVEKEIVCFYVFNIGDNDGFVIISGDDAVRPVLAYSDEGCFSAGDIPENVKDWLGFYNKEIMYAVANPSVQTYNEESSSNLRSANGAVEPLLGKIRWNQDDPYNLLCPYSKKYAKKTVTGCVATAMSQVMKYFNWPTKGVGSKTYTFSLDSTSTTLTANFGQTTYNWSNMLDDYSLSSTSSQDSAVALLLYHCGISTETAFKTSDEGGSTASMMKAGIALKTYFGYDPDIQLYRREFFDQTTWYEMLENELNAGRPVLYAGSSTEGTGHAFVCDGYDKDGLFHFNWGWGGNANGYFSINILDPDYAGIGSSSGGYSKSQYAVIGIQKSDGISNATYQLNLYNAGLASTKSSVSNIATEVFSVSSGFANYGLNSFNGNVAVGIYKDGVFKKYLKSVVVSDLATYEGTNSYSFTNLSLSGLTAGSYQLFFIYQPTGSSSWYKLNGNSTLNSYLNVTISGSSATIIKPVTKPDLTLSSAIQTVGKIYKNRTGRFSIPVKNNGYEFYSYISLYIYPTSGAATYQYLNKGIAAMKNGDSQSIEISGDITLSPGTYYAYAVYDSTNNFSDTNYKRVAQSSYSLLQFTIYSEPVDPVLVLNSKINITEGTAIYQNQTLNLNAEIKNTGGFFDDEIIAFIFPSKGGTSLGYIGPKKIYIDNNETNTFTLTGTYNLDPGNYKIGLYYYHNGWVNFTPTANYVLSVTMNPVAIEKVSAESINIGTNPVNETIDIVTNENVVKAEIFDLNGRELGRFSNSKNLPAGNLKKGVYLLRVTTDNGINNIHFIK